MKTISSQTFKHTLKDIHKNTENRKFCFVFGAGASCKSGIPAGEELAKQWFDEIQERNSKEENKNWIKENKINKKDLASHYGTIYRKRFESDKTSGYEFLVQKMKNATPSFGHIVLAQILSRIPGHCVLTTNFDSLIESAIYQFTNKTPLVCGHESLSGYARPSKIHPLIVKIHRDLLLSPKSDPDEINKLDTSWNEPLDNIFSSHIPIVIGYGGNDGSLMTYFEKMKKPSNFFWCGLNENDLSNRAKELIEKLEGQFVKINGFDELMHELLWVFDEIKPINDELNEITKKRIDIADKQLNEILQSRVVDDSKIKEEDISKALSAFEYSNLADKENNLDKRKDIYLKALKQYPETAWLWNDFTYFLKIVKKDYSNLEKYYLKTLSVDPENDIANGNYALYLNDIKKDYEKAGKYYLKALSVDPESANKNGNYAIYLKEIKKDYENAEKYYLKALSIDPEHAGNNGNYAQFLLGLDRKDKATSFLEKAFELNAGEKTDLLLELWYYKYAHYPEFIDEAEKSIVDLLSEGIRSIDWNFSDNIKVAIANNHPFPDKIKDFAKRITEPVSV